MVTKGAWWKLFISGGILMFAVGCSEGDQVNEILAQTIAQPTNTISLTSTPTITPEPTWTPLSPTLTPLPILYSNETEELILELLQTNAGCNLPCWWGMTPGITSWEETENIFRQFEKGAGTAIFHETGGMISDFNGQLGFSLSVVFKKKAETLWEFSISADCYSASCKAFDHEVYFGIMKEYTLDKVLSKYGYPSRVLIKSYNLSPGYYPKNYPTFTQLLYPEKGISIGYQSKNTIKFKEGNIWASTCPSKGTIRIRLFQPTTKSSFTDLFGYSAAFRGYKDIDEVTSLTVTEFVEIFQNPNCEILIETPADIWTEYYWDP